MPADVQATNEGLMDLSLINHTILHFKQYGEKMVYNKSIFYFHSKTIQNLIKCSQKIS